mgnify:CR=1 FL=1
MSTVDLHNEAMALAFEADAARKAGNLAEAAEHFARAMDAQRRAAELEATQPSRAIMFRSAAWLAVEAGKLRAAERIAMYALVDDGIPARVQEELREVCREVRVRAIKRQHELTDEELLAEVDAAGAGGESWRG